MRGGRRPAWEKPVVRIRRCGPQAFLQHSIGSASGRGGTRRTHGWRTGTSSRRAHHGRTGRAGRGPHDGRPRRAAGGLQQRRPRRIVSDRRSCGRRSGGKARGSQRGRFHARRSGAQHGRLCTAGTGRRLQTGTSRDRSRRPRSRRRDAGRLRGSGAGMDDAGFRRRRRRQPVMRHGGDARRRRRDDRRSVRRRCDHHGRRKHGKQERGAVIGAGAVDARAHADASSVDAARAHGHAAGHVRSIGIIGIVGTSGKDENGKKGKKPELHDSLPVERPGGKPASGKRAVAPVGASETAGSCRSGLGMRRAGTSCPYP